MKKTNLIFQWWLTPKFPLIHLNDKTTFIKKWILHPVKRRMARWYLKFLQITTPLKVIAITGSAGKTTVKEMLASVLALDNKTVCSKDNIDPIYNIPTTILKTPIGTKYLILEMGVEYPGEMDYYLWLAKPDVSVITNIFPTHLEFFGDINGVLKEKSKLVLGLEKDGVAILNSNDKLLINLASDVRSKIIWFDQGDNQVDTNVSATIAIAKCLGIFKNKIIEGINKYKKPPHRLSLIKLKSGAFLLDDSYNSNPQALSSILKYFAKIAGNNTMIAVLGDMKELGRFEEKYHKDLGKEIGEYNFKVVIGVGSAIRYLIDEIKSDTKTYLVENQESVLPVLKPYLQKGNYLLIKGSHSVGLDKLVDTLV